jgi:nitroreductase
MTVDQPTRDQVLSAISAAVLAPSVHNTQPWLFRLADGGVEVFADWRRQLTITDPIGRAARMSCGAAVYNLRVALANLGFESWAEVGSHRHGPVATVRVRGTRPPTPAEAAQYEAIGRRHSNRFPFLDTRVDAAERTALVRAAEDEGAWLSPILGPVALELVMAMMHLADRALTADDEYVAELSRWSRTDATSFDGVSSSAGGPAPEPHDLFIGRDFGGTPRAAGHDYEQDPFVAVLGTHVGSGPADINAGQALQRVLLTATHLGLSASLASQPIDVPAIRERLRIGLRRGGPPQMLLRIGRGLPAPATGRRPVDEVVLEAGEPVPGAEARDRSLASP